MNDLRIRAGALVLTADGNRARLLRNKGTALHVELVPELEMKQDNPPTREQGTDRPGRYGGGGDSNSRSAIEQTDWHRLAEERFAGLVAEKLYRLAHARAFDDLIVVAPPKVLGNLRAAFHPEVTTRVQAEVAKDLTALAPPEVAKLLS
jgi:protein required for attachment to host cells